MRAGQLLAAGLVCLPVLCGSGCGRVVSKVGEYATESSVSGAGVSGAGKAGAGGGSTAGTSGAAGSGVGIQADGGGAGVGVPIVPSGDGTCTFEPLDALRHPLDIYVMMDSNITLALGLWELAVIGLRDFAQDPRSAGIGMGVRYYGLECDSEAYEVPTVEVAPLPENEPAIRNKSTPNQALQSSQMLPAVQGAIAHQKKRAMTHAGRKQVVAVITDGITSDLNLTCPIYSADDVVAAAQAGFMNTPAIETYVLRLSTVADAVAVGQPLARVAAAGGTVSDIVIGPTDVPANVNEALQTVRRRARPCDYTLPNGADTARVGMAIATVGSATGNEIARVEKAADCLAQHGWHFDDTAAPTRMVLCPATCNMLRTGDGLSILPLTGCAPKTR